MNSDFRVDVDFFDHLKTFHLQRACGVEGVVSLLRLWARVAVLRHKGDLDGFESSAVEHMAGWHGAAGDFWEAITGRPDGLSPWVETDPQRILDEYDRCADRGIEIPPALRIARGTYAVRMHEWPIHQRYAFEADKRRDAARKAASIRWAKESAGDPKKSGGRAKRNAAGKDAPRNAPAPAPAPAPIAGQGRAGDDAASRPPEGATAAPPPPGGDWTERERRVVLERLMEAASAKGPGSQWAIALGDLAERGAQPRAVLQAIASLQGRLPANAGEAVRALATALQLPDPPPTAKEAPVAQGHPVKPTEPPVCAVCVACGEGPRGEPPLYAQAGPGTAGPPAFHDVELTKPICFGCAQLRPADVARIAQRSSSAPADGAGGS